MKLDSIVYTLAGMCFGVILGWVIGTQQGSRADGPAAIAAADASGATSAQGATGASAAQGAPQRQAPPFDEARAQALSTIMKSDPKNAGAAVQLGNVYFDAERWDDAVQWYQRAVDLDPRNADASTDLGVSFYYTNRTDEALAQFETSLAIDPTHTKTLLNKGIVLAFGKQDIPAAAVEWRKVVELAPSSPEGQAARRALDGVASGHAGEGATPASNP